MNAFRPWMWLAFVAFLLALAPGPVLTRAEEKDEDVDGAAKEAAKLEAIGGLSMVTARNTYLLIGVTADSFVKDVHTPDQVQAIMKAVVAQLDAVNGQLKKMQKTGLSEANDEYVDQIVSVYELLQEEARALTKFVAKKGEARATAFEKARKAAEEAIEKLAGDDKSDDEKPDEEKKDDGEK